MALPHGWSLKTETEVEDAQRGPSVKHTYSGPLGDGEADLIAFKADSTLAGYSRREVTKTPHGANGGGRADVVLTYEAAEDGTIRPPTDPNYGLLQQTWTMHANDTTLPVSAHDNVAVLRARYKHWPTLLETWVKMWRKASKDKLSEWTWTALPDNAAVAAAGTALTFTYLNSVWTPAGATAGEISLAAYYQDVLLRDENPTFTKPQYVLRKTQVVSSATQLYVAHTNVDRWLNYTALLASEPTLVFTPVVFPAIPPAVAMIKLASLSGLYWHKQTPQVEGAGNGNYQLVQEFWGGVWPTDTTAAGAMTFLFGAPVTS